MCCIQKIRKITLFCRNILDKIRLYFIRNKRESYLSFYKVLGFYPSKIDLYQQALLHKSYINQSDDELPFDNERLEFLGDAILDAVVGDLLYTKYPTKKEGFLTETRSKIVKRDTLNKIALELGLDKMVKCNSHSSSHNNYLYGNAFEALIGAIYLDKGYRCCKNYIEHQIIGNYINLEELAKKEVNFKSSLIEWSQKNKFALSFELIKEGVDENHNPIFSTEVLINKVSVGSGVGYSKKESQQKSAKMALSKIKNKDFLNELLVTDDSLTSEESELAKTDPHLSTLED